MLVAGPRLRGAVTEVEACAGFTDATVLEPPVSTVAGTVEALAAARLAHLACHGRLRADNPSFSALELVDGQLTVHELIGAGSRRGRWCWPPATRRPTSALLVTSCSASSSALLARGTAGLVASVVEVGDVEAVDLMRGLHERLRDGTMAVSVACRAGRPGPDGLTPVRQLVRLTRLRRRLNRTTSITRVKRYSETFPPALPGRTGGKAL